MMSEYFVLISTPGGIEAFGLNVFVIGPCGDVRRRLGHVFRFTTNDGFPA